MPTDEEILIEQGQRDLRKASQWCIFAWACLIFGSLAGTGASMLRWDVPAILCYCVVGAGTVFSVYAAFLAFLGIIFPGRCSRLRFAALLIISALPIVGPCLLFAGVHPT